MTRIASYRVRPHDVPLLEPFGIAGGAQEVARNVFVRVTLDDGSVGWGEAAPFPAVNGETQEGVLEALRSLEVELVGQPADRYRPLAAAIVEPLAATPSARVAVETAVLDAWARSRHVSLWELFGGAEPLLRRDVTIPTGDVEHARTSARRALETGFSQLKVKIGRSSLELDVRRLRAIHEAAPRAALLLDANASLSADEALWLLGELGPARARVELFEQPTAADDRDGLTRVERDGGVAVAADESARSLDDVARLVRERTCRVINVKTAKMGLIAAWDAVLLARSAGLDVMMGGMVETELSMTTSACLAGGVGGVRFVDLDTPLFLGPRPLTGGFVERGPELDLSALGAGHGVTWLGPF